MGKLAQSFSLEQYGGYLGESVKESNRLIPLKVWPQLYGAPSERMLRHLVFHSKINGFDKVIRRICNRITLHEGSFFRWLEEQNNGH